MSGVTESINKVFHSIWLYRIIRWILAGIFIWAGTVKLLDPDNFAVIIDEFNILPTRYVWPAAYVLPVFEIIAGLGLIFDLWGCLPVITGLMVFFMAVLVYGIRMGIDVDCGCFGMYDPDTSLYGKLKPALYRDLIIMIGIVYLYYFRWKRNRDTEKAGKNDICLK